MGLASSRKVKTTLTRISNYMPQLELINFYVSACDTPFAMRFDHVCKTRCP